MLRRLLNWLLSLVNLGEEEVLTGAGGGGDFPDEARLALLMKNERLDFHRRLLEHGSRVRSFLSRRPRPWRAGSQL